MLLSLPISDACLNSCLSIALMLEHLSQEGVSENWLRMPGICQPLCSNQHGCMGDKGGQTTLRRCPPFCHVPVHNDWKCFNVALSAECCPPPKSTEIE